MNHGDSKDAREEMQGYLPLTEGQVVRVCPATW